MAKPKPAPDEAQAVVTDPATAVQPSTEVTPPADAPANPDPAAVETQTNGLPVQPSPDVNADTVPKADPTTLGATDSSEPTPTTDAPEPSAPIDLLATGDPDDKLTAIRDAAESAWAAFRLRDDLAGSLAGAALTDFAGLTALERMGLVALALTIVNDPHQPTYAAVSPDNNDRRTMRNLEGEIRRALGYAEVYYP